MRSIPCLAPTALRWRRPLAARHSPSYSLASGGVLRRSRCLGGRLGREGDIQRVATEVVREDDPLEQPPPA